MVTEISNINFNTAQVVQNSIKSVFGFINTIFQIDISDKKTLETDDSIKGTFSKVFSKKSTSPNNKPTNRPSKTKKNGNKKVGTLNINIKKLNNIISKNIKDAENGKTLLESSRDITEKNGVTTVKVHIKRYSGKKVIETSSEFSYNKELLEKYVISQGIDKSGNVIKYFSSIPDIKKLPENKRTLEQKKLLKEFNNMINFAIDSGTEYGVDPKFVIAIIQREVAFQGLGSNVTGKNGKGYMQLTSAPIKDYLGYAGDRKYHGIKEAIYGPEMEELLISRNFNPKAAKTQAQREDLYNKIFSYLTKNKDPEFNVRFGTLVLRRYLNKSKGNIKLAATYYNGSSNRLAYGAAVSKYYNKINQHTGITSKFTYREITV